MLENDTDLLNSIIQINQDVIDININIKNIQKNLIMMGFDIIMINKVLSIFKIKTEEEAIDYFIKSENGMWNHPFIPKKEETEEEILGQSKDDNNSFFSKIYTIKQTISSNKNDDNSKDDIINNDNINDNKTMLIKEVDEDICEICGESKQFHLIKEFNSDNNNIAKENIIFEDNLIKKDNNNIISKENDEDEDINKNECQICLDELDNPVILENCQHQFCFECFHSYLVF